LLDRQGRLIGVNTAIFSPTQVSVGIGFSIPVSTVARVVPDLIAQGYYAHPWLGVTLFDITPDRAATLREAGLSVPVDEGGLVIEVAAGGPAEAAGLRGGNQPVRWGSVNLLLGGDLITAVAGEAVRSARDFTVLEEARLTIGEPVTVTFYREGQLMELQVIPAERPGQAG
jgi:S1-C subfamily serine protease